jgi:inorganic pyrophosphatase
MTLYLSAGNGRLSLFPNLKNCLVRDVKELFQGYPINYKVFHTQPVPDSHTCDACIIVDQKPLAGSLVDLQKSLHVQLQLD